MHTLQLKILAIETNLLHLACPPSNGFSNVSVHQNHLEGLLEHSLPAPIPRVSASVGLGQGLRIHNWPHKAG